MPTVPALIDGLSSRFGFEQSKAKSLGRYMREANLLTTGARGVNAPSATTRDAARLLIAMMLNTQLASVADDVRLVGGFVPMNGETFSTVFEPANLEDAIVHLIDHVTGKSEDYLATLHAKVVLTPYLAVARIEIAYIRDAGEDEAGDEDGHIVKQKGVSFSLPGVGVIGVDLPTAYLDAVKRFPRGFHQAPELWKEDIIGVAKLVAGDD